MSSEVISRLISELKPHPRNYNNHSDRQVVIWRFRSKDLGSANRLSLGAT